MNAADIYHAKVRELIDGGGSLDDTYEIASEVLRDYVADAETTLNVLGSLPRADRQALFRELVVEGCFWDGADYWPVVGALWTDTESPGKYSEHWREVFAAEFLDREGPGRTAMMSLEELAALVELPDEVTVYRGFDREGGAEGFSWTLDRERAGWFARRFPGDAPSVATGTVARNDIIAVFFGREEAEVVALPEDVTVIAVEPL